MGDMVFFVPPVLAALKKRYPDCEITLVTAWGFKEKRRTWSFRPGEFWGNRNQSGLCISLMMTDPHVDHLVHWHDKKLSLSADICREDGRSFPTWSAAYYQSQKNSGKYDGVYELDFGIGINDNPLQRMYEAVGLPDEKLTQYKIYLTESDILTGRSVIENYPHPRIVLLEGIEGSTTRGWDPGKIPALHRAIQEKYGVDPIWFGSRFPHHFQGRPLTLRENIATLTACDAAIGVMSGPLHFAAAVGLPTITLYGDQPLHRAAPAFFLNEYITDEKKKHRTLLGPSGKVLRFLKEGTTQLNLTAAEKSTQEYRSWLAPGRQSTKSCVAVLTVDEVLAVLDDVVSKSTGA